MMKKMLFMCMCLLLVLVLCSCGGGDSQTATTKAEENVSDRTGLSFSRSTVWRATETVLETPNTFEVWLKLSKGKATDEILLSTGGNGSPMIQLSVDSEGAPSLEWKLDETVAFRWRFKDVSLRTDNWEHLAVVRDVKAGRIFCYVNGMLKQEIAAHSSPDLLPVRPYCIGGNHSVIAKNSNCTGQISSVALFSTVRTGEQIVADMQEPSGNGLLAWYDLSNVTGETVKDLSSLGNDLVHSVRWFSEKEPVTDYAYSMVVVGDTQVVAQKAPYRFREITQYIADHVEDKNIQFVMGMGDITNDNTVMEWEAAREAYSLLDGVVPYSLVRGNEGHDGLEEFYNYFPYSKYANTISGAKDDNMRNVYYNFEVGAVKYMVVVLDSSPSDEEINWASQVIADHPDRNVILTTHVYLYRDGTTLGPNDLWPMSPNNGDDLWEKLVRKHENIVLVLCGHDPCSQLVLTQTKGDHGNIVTQMLVDGQGVDSTDDVSGLIAILYFSEDGKSVTVEYYSPLKRQFFLTENQFSFTLDTVD